MQAISKARFLLSPVMAPRVLVQAQQAQRRWLNIHEYQSAQVMASVGVNVPFGIAVKTVEEAVSAAKTIGDDEVVIKSQILAGAGDWELSRTASRVEFTSSKLMKLKSMPVKCLVKRW